MKNIFKNLLKGCKEDEKLLFFHPVTVLLDSQVSDCCLWATCLQFLFVIFFIKLIKQETPKHAAIFLLSTM